MRKPVYAFVVHCLDRMICILVISKVWGSQLASLVEQAGLNLTW